MASKSRVLFEEGKTFLLEKNYKDAIRCFTLSIKTFPANLDSRYYRAICQLDLENTKKCIQDLNELIEADPGYNQTVFVILSIAYRRENDISNSLRAVRIIHNSLIAFERNSKVPQVCGSLSGTRSDPHLYEAV